MSTPWPLSPPLFSAKIEPSFSSLPKKDALMPFKSEKQRRFLWLKHPDIAKRWAHEYPKSNKNLPMYADSKDKEKKAALDVLARILAQSSDVLLTTPVLNKTATGVKAALDKLEYVKIPHSDKPTYAGQEREQGEQNSEQKPQSKINSILDEVNRAQDSTDPVLQKLSTVLAQPFRRMMEHQKAQDEGREPRYVPQIMGLKRYSLPTATVPPPMGSTPAPAAPAPQQAPATAQIQQPGNARPGGPVGGGSNPMHNPIQAFGPLSSSGVINGNAAFGVKNSPDSLKTAAKSLPNWHGTEGLVQTPSGYQYGYTHGVDVRDTAPGLVTRLFDRDPYIMRDDVQKMKKRLRAIRGLYIQEQPYKLEFAHKGQLSPEMRRLIDAALSKEAASSPAWQRAAGKNPEGGLNAKGRASYKAQTGGTLKAPVTESNPSGERAKRQNSFCSRMCGMKRVNTGAKAKSDPDSRINKSLRKWNCKCGSATDLLVIAHGHKEAGMLQDFSRGVRRRVYPTVAALGSLVPATGELALKTVRHPIDVGQRIAGAAVPVGAVGGALWQVGKNMYNTHMNIVNMAKRMAGQK